MSEADAVRRHDFAAEHSIGASQRVARGVGRLLIRSVVYTSAWVAAGLASLSVFAAHVLDIPLPIRVPLLIFASAMFVYNMDHVADARVQAIPDAEAQRFFRQPAILFLLVASAVATGLLVGMAPRPAQYVFAAYTTIGLTYGLPIVPSRSAGRLRWARLKEIAGLKGWLVSAALTLAAVGLPVAWVGNPVSIEVLQASLFIFVYISTNAHMFDVRDMQSDIESGVATMPTQLGLRRTKQLLVLLNLVMLALMAWGWARGLTTLHPEVLLCFVVSIAYVLAIDTKTPRLVYSILVDGTVFLPSAVIFVHHVSS